MLLIILWSVIHDQWFSKIEFSIFFLKICQPLEFLLRSEIRDPQLIFVFAILIKRDFLARLMCIWFCDPWSVIIDFLKLTDQSREMFVSFVMKCQVWCTWALFRRKMNATGRFTCDAHTALFFPNSFHSQIIQIYMDHHTRIKFGLQKIQKPFRASFGLSDEPYFWG